MEHPAGAQVCADASAVDALPRSGDLIAARYRIERQLARGGMGAVYVAEHLGLARRVALKLLAIDAPEAAARFQREARATARLESEHVVRVLDVGVHGEVPFLAMELLSGVDLAAYVAARGPLPIADAVAFVLQACVGLAEAHAQGIVHRDLKPSNLFLTQRADGSPLVKLLDFGIAKAPASEAWTAGNLTGAIQILGSPPYMSPEHVRDPGSVDARTDLWSLGITLYELLTKRHPFEATSAMHLGVRIALEPHAPLARHLPNAPAELEHVVARCLQKDPAARFQSVVELARALAPFGGATTRVALDRVERASIGVAGPTLVAASRSPMAEDASTGNDAADAPPSGVLPISDASGMRPRFDPPSCSTTARFRRQHEELQALGLAIARKLSRRTLAGEASLVRRMVAQFAGKLAVHASMENGALYPRLLAHRDPALRAQAEALFEEVNGIYEAFGEYTKRWPSAASIERDVAGFASDTRALLARLAFRMTRENDELYPMVERVEGAA